MPKYVCFSIVRYRNRTFVQELGYTRASNILVLFKTEIFLYPQFYDNMEFADINFKQLLIPFFISISMLQSTEDARCASQLKKKIKQLQTSGILDDELASFLWKDLVGRTRDKQAEVRVLFLSTTAICPFYTFQQK